MLLVLVLAIICTVIITERSFVNSVKNSGRYVYETAKTDAILYRERSERRREENQERYARRQEEAEERSRRRLEQAEARRLEAEAKRAERLRLKEEEQARQDAQYILQASLKAPGVMESTDLKRNLPKKTPEDMHEITLTETVSETVEKRTAVPMEATGMDFDRINIHTMQQDFEETVVSDSAANREVPFAEEGAGKTSVEEDGCMESKLWREMPAPALEPVPDRAPEQVESIVVPEADVYRDMKEICFSPKAKASRLRRYAQKRGHRACEAGKAPSDGSFSSKRFRDEGLFRCSGRTDERGKDVPGCGRGILC